MTMARISVICFIPVLLTFKLGWAADPFLQKQGGSLLDDLQAVLGPNSLRGRVGKLEGRLQSMFDSLPRSSGKRIGHATARYALHRIIVDLHGWSVSGLEPNKSTFNTTALVGSGILSGLLPAYVEDIFAAHTHADGFSLGHLAILGSTIEHLVHEDQKEILRKACEVFDLPTMDTMTEDNMRTIIQLYMASFLQSIDASRLKGQMARRLLTKMPLVYPGWEDSTMLIDDEREALVYQERDVANPFRSRVSSLHIAMRVVERIADNFVRSQAEPECQEIKESLLEYERVGTGRIRLADFYRAGLNSRFFFIETKEYLRAFGALDESDSLHGPKVIVPNYVLSKSNCLAHTHHYSICCINECEGLYGQLEHGIAAPEGTPQQIAPLVAKLSSSTVQAPRNLSVSLLRRLDEIAAEHGGNVPLHGRLFAQWMHQAFPRECPYPHLVGSTTSLSPSVWANRTGQDHSIEKFNSSSHPSLPGVINSYIDSIELSLKQLGATESVEDGDAHMMWTTDEEQFVKPTRSLVRRFAAALGSLGVSFRFIFLPVLGTAIAFAVKSFAASDGGRAKVEHQLV